MILKKAVKVRGKENMMEAIKRILVVDDEEEFVNTITRHLKRERFILHSARNGEDAREKIHQTTRDLRPYDLVITDVIMPKVSGIELLQWIKKNHAGVSVLVVSGFGDQNQVIGTIRPDMDACCQKPLTPFEMMKLIGNIDQKRRECGYTTSTNSTAIN